MRKVLSTHLQPQSWGGHCRALLALSFSMVGQALGFDFLSQAEDISFSKLYHFQLPVGTSSTGGGVIWVTVFPPFFIFSYYYTKMRHCRLPPGFCSFSEGGLICELLFKLPSQWETGLRGCLNSAANLPPHPHFCESVLKII